MKDLMGYAHPRYALSLQEFGEPRELPRCGGWILVRSIPGTPYKDAMGCYPFFACRDWTKLHEDLEHVGSDLVSLALVTDPFSEVAPTYLEQYFDLFKSFKTHFMADLSYPSESFVNKQHRYKTRKSLKGMDIEICCQPTQYLDEWARLYDNLINRHHIKGLKAFSYECFEIQLNIPGMVVVLGRREGEIVGAAIFLISDQGVYIHLSASSEIGYKIHASYGIRWKAYAFLREKGIRYLDNGGMAGITENLRDGLVQFKRGWSNERRIVYFCGLVFDRQKYESICQQYQIADVDYFPAYRVGEFND